jgi:hypothetical protein
MPAGKLKEKKYGKNFFLHPLKWRKDPDPDPLVRGADPRIRIRTKMSRIPNNAYYPYRTGSVFNKSPDLVINFHNCCFVQGAPLVGLDQLARVLQTKQINNLYFYLSNMKFFCQDQKLNKIVTVRQQRWFFIPWWHCWGKQFWPRYRRCT